MPRVPQAVSASSCPNVFAKHGRLKLILLPNEYMHETNEKTFIIPSLQGLDVGGTRKKTLCGRTSRLQREPDITEHYMHYRVI